jgi:rod shape-determining protein MreB
MAIGSQSAEAIKLAVGSASRLPEELSTRIRGRDLLSGLPREMELDSEEVRRAIDPPLTDIMAAVHATLEETPPELAADIATQGIVLAGGGALLRGFADRVHRETGMPVHIADAPLTCVAYGAGQSLEELDTLGRRRGAA